MPEKVQPLISLQTAWEHISRSVQPGPMEDVSIGDAMGRVLAKPVNAAADYPAFDRSMMDGYAVRSTSTLGAPCSLRIVGTLPAGQITNTHLREGEAMRINTGAQLPTGADAVVPIEDTESDEDGCIKISRIAAAGRCVSKRGSIRTLGRSVLDAPVRVRSAQLAALASTGVTSISAYRQPSVAVVVTGDELVPLGTRPAAGQIVDSNGPMLAALARECGATVVRSLVARDDEHDLERVLAEALSAVGSGVVVAVGGMSKGTRDLVPGIANKLGVRWVFHGVNMRPGKPAGLGIGPAGQLFFGLPGNPVSSAVCFLALARMAIDGMVGLGRPTPLMFRARIAEPIGASVDPRPAFLPANISLRAGEPVARLTDWRGSSDPFGPAAANGYVFQSGGHQAMKADDWVEVLPMPGTADDWRATCATEG